MRLSESVVLPEFLTVRQLHLLDSELAPWGVAEPHFTSGAHPTIIMLDAALKAKIIDFPAADEMDAAEAAKLAARLTELADKAREVPKA